MPKLNGLAARKARRMLPDGNQPGHIYITVIAKEEKVA